MSATTIFAVQFFQSGFCGPNLRAAAFFIGFPTLVNLLVFPTVVVFELLVAPTRLLLKASKNRSETNEKTNDAKRDVPNPDVRAFLETIVCVFLWFWAFECMPTA